MPRALAATLLAVAATASADPARGAQKAPAPDARVALPVVGWRLDNGLAVQVAEDHTLPVVSVNVWYFVGSKDERPGRTGFAHLFEHLMFEGSAHVGPSEHLTRVAEAGGSANATTSEDRTDFFETLPSSELELALWLESDRMGFLAEALTQEKLEKQRAIVQNERRQDFDNQPYGLAPFAVAEALYPPGHPYHHLAIGSHADLEAATLDDVRDFFRAWYVPENAVLSITGDVTVARARELSARWFGGLPSHPPPPRPEPPAKVVLAKDTLLRQADRVSFERLYLVWPSPKWLDPGDAELDLLATVLGGRGGRLDRVLVHERHLAQEVHVAQASAKLGSAFEIEVTAAAGHTAAECRAAVTAELARLLGDAPVTAAELERARALWEAHFVYALEGLERRADLVAQYFDGFGSGDSLARDRARYLSATVTSVGEAARSVLGAHRVELVVGPATEPAGDDKGAR